MVKNNQETNYKKNKRVITSIVNPKTVRAYKKHEKWKINKGGKYNSITTISNIYY